MFLKVSIEYWKRAHMTQILELEALASKQEGRGREAEDYFLELLGEESIVGCVAHRDNELYGFMIYELFGRRLDIAHWIVHPDWQRCGVATQMWRNLVGKCQVKERQALTWNVREKNLPVCVFLRKMGAKCVQIKRDFYSEPIESGYLFQYNVPKSEFQPLELQLS